MGSVETFTFVCLAANQVATVVDIQALPETAYRARAFFLLRQHAGVETVEVWRAETIVARIDRDGVRPRTVAQVGASALVFDEDPGDPGR